MDHPHDCKVESAHYLFMYKEGSDRFHGGVMEVLSVTIDRGLLDLEGV